MKKLLVLLLFSLSYVPCTRPSCPGIDSIFQWDINEDWIRAKGEIKEEHEEEPLNKTQEWNPQDYLIGGMKIWQNYMYIYIPRRKQITPMTLGRAFMNKSSKFLKFEPYPNHKMQTDIINGFHSIQGMEIDPYGRMWLLDNPTILNVRRRPKLMVLDLKNNSNTILNHKFSLTELWRPHSNMIDIVFDHEKGGLAYIYNHHKDEQSLIVFSLNNSRSSKFSFTCLSNWTDALSRRVLALSPAGYHERFLYFLSPQTNYLYKIPVEFLREPSDICSGAAPINTRSGKLLRSMTMLGDGRIVFGVVNQTVGFEWQTSLDFTEKNIFGLRSSNPNERLNTFGFDENGFLWYLHEIIDTNKVQYVVIKSQLTYPKSYQPLD